MKRKEEEEPISQAVRCAVESKAAAPHGEKLTVISINV
jgi:hypothetical protein